MGEVRFSRRFIHSMLAPYVIAMGTVLNVVFLKFAVSYVYLVLLLFFSTFLLVDCGINFHKVKSSFLIYSAGVIFVFFLSVLGAQDFSATALFARGLFIYLLFPFYWCIYFMHFDEHDFWTVANKFIKTMGVVIAVCGIIQYFYSKTLFGLYDDSWSKNFLYSSQLNDYKLLFRANSLLGSSQIYSLFMAFSTIYYSETTALNRAESLNPFNMNNILLLLFFTAGLLSGAKSFLFLLAIFYTLKYFKLEHLIKIVFGFLFIFIALEVLSNTELLKYRVISRVADFSNIVNEETAQSGRMAIYKSLLAQSVEDETLFLGSGPGSHMTFSDLDKNSEHTVAESYLLQIYVELGIIVFLLFLVFIFSSFSVRQKNTRTQILKKILIIEIVSMSFVHGFNSPAMFLFWGPFLMPLTRPEFYLTN
ncbi:O-antigen ligase family protein [Fluoribacter dumoffii]|uniref:O-antigen ligase family protein n=1 Tax=Fluoribacter dumoffii TaxID=463 RepID=UPI00026C7D15|nr:O-antigen ligase family protein [Fluoribacter dumoffii]